jgi:hypothetical protein
MNTRTPRGYECEAFPKPPLSRPRGGVAHMAHFILIFIIFHFDHHMLVTHGVTSYQVATLSVANVKIICNGNIEHTS